MEFDDFAFDAQTFLKVPSINQQKEVCVVLKNSLQRVVGGNKPYFQLLKKQSKKQKRIDQCNDEDEKESLLVYEKLVQQNKWQKSISNQRWIFLAGDLYLDFDSFSNYSQNYNEDDYSHWNEWRPQIQHQFYNKHILLEMGTENEGPSEFEGVIAALESLGNKESNEVGKLLGSYSQYLIKETQRIDKAVSNLQQSQKEQMKESLFVNYNESLEIAKKILSDIGNKYPLVYLIRRTSHQTLRGQVSAIGFNFKLTQILCENKEEYLDKMLSNKFPEVFSRQTHLQLLLLNLRGEEKINTEIKTVDNISIECSLTPLSFPLSSTQVNDLTLTDTLRIYKFEFPEFQLKKLVAMRLSHPLPSLQNEAMTKSDPFLQSYYQQICQEEVKTTSLTQKEDQQQHKSDTEVEQIVSTKLKENFNLKQNISNYQMNYFQYPSLSPSFALIDQQINGMNLQTHVASILNEWGINKGQERISQEGSCSSDSLTQQMQCPFYQNINTQQFFTSQNPNSIQNYSNSQSLPELNLLYTQYLLGLQQIFLPQFQQSK